MSFHLGNRGVLKILSRLDEGSNAEVELGQFLRRSQLPCPVVPLLGAVELRRRRTQPLTLAVLHEFVPSEGDACRHARDALQDFLERVLTLEPELQAKVSSAEPGSDTAARDLLNGYPELMQRLGQRLAELHVALASDPSDARFAPEDFTPLYQRSLYQSLRARVLQTLDALARQLPSLSAAQQQQAREVLALRGAMLNRVQAILTQRIGGQRIRCHGDFQLGHLLFTGKDFVIGSLEGDPNLPLSERRIKRSPLDDLACLLTSVDAVARRVLADVASAGGPTPGALRHSDLPLASRWLQWWLDQVQGAILTAYESAAGLVPLLPETAQGRQLLLGVFRLELALQDLDLVLREQPERLSPALESVLHLAGGRGQATGGA